MKAAKYYSNSDVRIEEVPVPEIGPRELLVKMKFCGICSSDALEWYRKPRAPMFLGHEATGIVERAGKEVKKVKVGDRVYIHHHIPCHTCYYCLRGSFTMCPTYRSTHLDPGGFAEYFRAGPLNTEKGVIKLPAEMGFQEGTLIEPISCCIRGLKRVNMHPQDLVVIVGAGFNGLTHLQLAKLWGAGKVLVLDLLDWKLKKASQLGADYTINPAKDNPLEIVRELNKGRGADLVIVTAGNVKAVALGLQLVEKGCTLYIYGPASPENPLPLDISHIFFSEISIIPSYSSTETDTHLAFELLQEGKIKAGNLITHQFDLTEIDRAFQLVTEAGESLKVLVENK